MAAKPRKKQDYLGPGYRKGEDPDRIYSRDDPFVPPKGAKPGVGRSPGFGPPKETPPKLGEKRGLQPRKGSKKR